MKLSTTVLGIFVYLWFYCDICVCVCARARFAQLNVFLFCAWDYLFLCVHNSRLDTFSISILKSKYFMAFCSSGFAGLTWIRYVRSFSKWMCVYSFVYHDKDHPCQVWWFNVLLNSIMLFVYFSKVILYQYLWHGIMMVFMFLCFEIQLVV